MTPLLIALIVAVIVLNIWNAFNAYEMRKRPLLNNEINDKKYWELKYKMQFMLTVFTVIVFAATFLGITTLSNVKSDVRKEFQTSLDSLSGKIDTVKNKLAYYTDEATYQFERMDSIGRILQLLGIKQKEVSTFISGTYKSANELDGRVKELMKNDQIRQNMYIVDNVQYKMPNDYAMYQKVYFKDLKTVNGNSLPNFIKPPYVIGLSSEGSDLLLANVTNDSLELIISTYMGERDPKKPFIITLIFVENK